MQIYNNIYILAINLQINKKLTKILNNNVQTLSS